MASIFEFPNPVNDKAARVVASGVVLLAVVFLITGWTLVLWLLALGFAARVLSGPRFSPLGLLATKVIAPRLGEPRLTPGPPKRFAQTIGLAFSIAALIVTATAGTGWAKVVIAALGAAATLEAALGLCLGCKIFGVLMRIGVIPESVCEECSNLSTRYPELSRS
jgi:hypothetical protein